MIEKKKKKCKQNTYFYKPNLIISFYLAISLHTHTQSLQSTRCFAKHKQLNFYKYMNLMYNNRHQCVQ